MGWPNRDLHTRFLRLLSMGYDNSKGYATETRRHRENPGQNENGKRNSSYFAFSLCLCVSVPLWPIPNTVTLDEKLKEIPRSPGVYLYKDAAGKIIYIGKAKNLRNRVRSYFQAGRAGDLSYEIKTAELIRQIADVEIIVTDN